MISWRNQWEFPRASRGTSYRSFYWQWNRIEWRFFRNNDVLSGIFDVHIIHFILNKRWEVLYTWYADKPNAETIGTITEERICTEVLSKSVICWKDCWLYVESEIWEPEMEKTVAEWWWVTWQPCLFTYGKVVPDCVLHFMCIHTQSDKILSFIVNYEHNGSQACSYINIWKRLDLSNCFLSPSRESFA